MQMNEDKKHKINFTRFKNKSLNILLRLIKPQYTFFQLKRIKINKLYKLIIKFFNKSRETFGVADILLPKGKVFKVLTMNYKEIQVIAVINDTKVSIYRIDMPSKIIAVIEAHSNIFDILSVLHKNNEYLVTSDTNNLITVWDIENPQKFVTQSNKFDKPFLKLKNLSLKSKYNILALSSELKLIKLSLDNINKPIVVGKIKESTCLKCIIVNTNDYILTSHITENNNINIIEINNIEKPKLVLVGHTNLVLTIELFNYSNSVYLATSGNDCTINIWNIDQLYLDNSNSNSKSNKQNDTNEVIQLVPVNSIKDAPVNTIYCLYLYEYNGRMILLSAGGRDPIIKYWDLDELVNPNQDSNDKKVVIDEKDKSQISQINSTIKYKIYAGGHKHAKYKSNNMFYKCKPGGITVLNSIRINGRNVLIAISGANIITIV